MTKNSAPRVCFPLLLPFLLLGLSGCPDDGGVQTDSTLIRFDQGGPDEGPQSDAGPVDMAVNQCRYPADCPGGDCIEGRCVADAPVRCLPGDACDDDAACADGRSCVDGKCRRDCPDDEICGALTNNFWCERPCEIDRTCPVRSHACTTHRSCNTQQVCVEGRCIMACTHDGECPAEGYCYEGECRPHPGDLLDGEFATPLAPAPGRIFAGVGVVPLSYPVGVSMAGFGGRVGPRNPYALALGGSDRVFERQDARVIVLSTDDDLAVLLRLPLCWSTDYLITRTAVKVQAQTGIDYSRKIITFGTHSHSQPGRFWNLAPEAGFGGFGFGKFSNEMVERYSDAFAAAIVAALRDLQPARVGWHLNPAFDPERRIHSNRRSNGPDITDDRMLVMRIDDADGRPMAALVNLAIHGTHMNLPWITGDVAGAIEVVATEGLSAEAGHFVPVLFANGTAGNISPRGDDNTNVDWGKMQVVGHRVWPIFKAGWDAATPDIDPPLEVVQRRIPVNYELLGYDLAVPEYRHNGKALEYGGFQCVPAERGEGEPDYVDGMLGCVIDLHAFRGVPTVQAHKTVLGAFKLGNLVVTTLPGEPTSQVGQELTRFIKEDAAAAGADPIEVAHFGYSNDHHLYLTLEDDWFRGGYEAAQSLWGWRLGRYFVENSRALAAQFLTPETESNATAIKPTVWPNLEDDRIEPTTGAVPAIIVSVPEATRRGRLVEMRWNGGHPGADLPVVALEIEEDGVFVPAIRNGQPFDTRGFETLMFYTGNYLRQHVWVVRWELPWDMPLGNYRMVVDGKHWRDGSAAPYHLDGAAFGLRPAQLVAREVSRVDGRIALKINYPDGPSNDDGVSAFDGLQPRGHWLRLDAEKSWGGVLKAWSFLLGPDVPLDGIQVTVDAIAIEHIAAPDVIDRGLITSRTADGSAGTDQLPGWESTRVEADLPEGAQYVRVADAHGNAVVIDLTE